MTTTRTDIHRPSSEDFDPEAYDCWGVYDMNPEWPDPQASQARMEQIRALLKDGYRFGAGSSRQCGHCGALIRYAALMVHRTVKEFIYVGEICLDGRFEMTKGEFQTLRKAAKLNRERMAKAERISKIYEDHPMLVWLDYLPELLNGYWNQFLYDIARKLNQYGELSEKQIAAVEKSIIKTTERTDAYLTRKAAEAAAEAAEIKTEAPEGRVEITGEVLVTKWVENDFGGALKMLVKADGFKVWSTVPSSLFGNYDPDSGNHYATVDSGSKIRFTATLTRSNDDPSFAFAKRPTKAERLS